MPVAIVAGEPGSVETDHEAGIAETDFGNQSLEAVALRAARAGFAEILVDDVHAAVRPAKSNVARRGKKLDALLDACKEIADTRRHIDLLIASSEPLHEAVVELFDA